MKTKTLKIAMYRNIPHGYTFVQDVEKHGHRADQILISNVVSVDFEIIGDDGVKDAFKALQIKDAKYRIELAEKELEALL